VSVVFDLNSLKLRLTPQLPTSNSSEAAIAIIINAEPTASVLLIKRVEREGDPWSGQIAFPGGHKSQVDHTLLETVIRETSEEVGIELQPSHLLGILPSLPTHTRRVEVTPFVFHLTSKARLNPNYEVAETFWAPLTNLMQIEPMKSEVKTNGKQLSVESYVYRGHIIWGLTFRILNLLLNKGKDPDR
jgi:8-oxo-dGTP pyrophosphatase MutT (NUDIX family)